MSNGTDAVAARWNPLRGIYAWVMRHAEGRHAWWIMAAIAFAESSFLPLPPDLMLVPMTLARRNRAFMLAAWCTFWSVSGGVLGYAIGSLLYKSVGLWLINAYGMAGDVQAFSVCYKHNAPLILLQGLTPIPYKLVTISAGFAHLGLGLFVVLSTITRGVRFFGEATLLYFFGAKVKFYLDKYLEVALIGFLVLVIGGIIAARYVFGASLC
jgi:membrane protein YqaA with SNARE-associated domain